MSNDACGIVDPNMLDDIIITGVSQLDPDSKTGKETSELANNLYNKRNPYVKVLEILKLMLQEIPVVDKEIRQKIESMIEEMLQV
jgi:hypothetical protein